ncbi:MAG: hypothetical protein IKW45_09960 [Clostridia bacterium]|nr:hypothetical protein [Clostridia bacterium]
MKPKLKLMALILSVAMIFSLVGCGVKTKEIVLTKENFEEYFTINSYTSDYYESSKHNSLFGGTDYDCSCNLNIEINKAGDFEVKDIVVTFKIVSSWDPISGQYTDENYNKFIDVNLPQNGSISKTYRCTLDTYFSMANLTPTVYFYDVKGIILV